MAGVLALAIAGCGSDSDPGFACSLNARDGTYLLTWTETSGDCGPIPSGLVRTDQANPAGCTETAPPDVSRDQCKLTRTMHCELAGSVTDSVSITEQRDPSGNRLTGTISMYGSLGSRTCSSTYSVEYVRQ